MDENDKLSLLKSDLQIVSNANDIYLLQLIDMSAELIAREGIVVKDNLECNMIQIHYAAYLFRKRAGTDTAMPRFLRYELNNLLIHQKGRKEDGS